MNNLTIQLYKQAARTVASRTIRKTAKNFVPTNSLLYKVGVSALIAAAGHLLTNGLPRASPTIPLLDDGFDEPPKELTLTEKEMEDILNQRMLKKEYK